MSVHAVIESGANIVVAFAAAGALYLARKQIAVSREVSALEAYEEYHKLCIELPEFSSGTNPNTLTGKNKDRYLSFVLYVLMVGERIHLMFPKNRDWALAIEDDVRTHRLLIESDEFQYYRSQDWAIKHIINSVLQEPKIDNGTVVTN